MTAPQLSNEDLGFYFEFLKMQVQVITSRNQFLLVFQSMLLGAMGVLMGKPSFFPLWIIMVLGLVVSLGWLYVNAVSHTNEEYLEDILAAHDARFAAVVHARKNRLLLAAGDSSTLLAFLFPSLMIVMWITILGFYFGSR